VSPEGLTAGRGSRRRSAHGTAGLPLPEPQFPLADSRGHIVAHADLGSADWRVPLENEGRQDADPEQFGGDVDRYSLMAAHGWLPLRYAGTLLARPWTVVDRIRRALLSRGWRG